ncbi:hypothetical protein PTKIN_Ptkin05aG0217700 [Pterospermum kingtungense]
MNEATICELSFSHQFPPTSSYGNCLNSCLTQHWGDLPLKMDDSEDMIIYNSLHDALNFGWSPSDSKVSAASAAFKAEPRDYESEMMIVPVTPMGLT